MIAERVKEVRKKSKMSQQEFGKCLGVSRDVIGNIEYGRVEPKDLFIDHLCHIFSVSREWLLTGNGNMSDEHIESKKNIQEAVKILENLSPLLQDYAVQQMKNLLNVQKSIQ